jgi:hypothetical protein
MGRQYPDYLTTLSKDIGIDANTIAWAKGADSDPKVISVLSNKGQDASDYSIELCDGHGYSAGDELLDVVACKSTTVGDNGCLTVWVTDGEPVVMAKKSALEGSTLCGVPGDSKVVLEEQAIISTTWTSMVSGSPSVFHDNRPMEGRPGINHICDQHSSCRQGYLHRWCKCNTTPIPQSDIIAGDNPGLDPLQQFSHKSGPVSPLRTWPRVHCFSSAHNVFFSSFAQNLHKAIIEHSDEIR